MQHVYKYNGDDLPGNLFIVRLPIIATYTEQEMEIMGLPMDNDLLKNKKTPNLENMTNAMVTVKRMITLYSEGYPIYLINSEDSKKTSKEQLGLQCHHKIQFGGIPLADARQDALFDAQHRIIHIQNK